MEELIPLERKGSKKLKKTVDKYKGLLKKGEVKLVEEDKSEVSIKPKKKAKKVKKFYTKRGIVYLTHIPHGFYEDQMRTYFEQFGKVTNVKLARSRTTGRSKGHAFIEFELREVAKIAAETMNGYLMCKRLLKATYIAPEEQKFRYFKGIPVTPKSYPHKNKIKKLLKVNHLKTKLHKELNSNQRRLNTVDKIIKKLSDLEIEYDFKPVDVPELLDDSDEKPDISNKPLLEVDSSDDDIVFKTPPGCIRVAKKKKSKTVSPKIDKKLSNKIKKSNKKQSSILQKDSKKMNLIKQEILSGSNIEIKTLKDIKQKKKSKKNK